MRIFLDANILFSAAIPDSRIQILVTAAFRHEVCLTNNYAIQEAERNLVEKFPAYVSNLNDVVLQCEIVPPAFLEIDVEIAAKDLPILRDAVGGRATHLLTGDHKDFGALFGKIFHNVLIVSPKMLAQDFAIRGWL